jgi:hypothetical protein
MGAHGAMGDAATIRYRNKKLKIDQIKTHGQLLNH